MAYIKLIHTSGMMVMIMLIANCNTCVNKKDFYLCAKHNLRV